MRSQLHAASLSILSLCALQGTHLLLRCNILCKSLQVSMKLPRNDVLWPDTHATNNRITSVWWYSRDCFRPSKVVHSLTCMMQCRCWAAPLNSWMEADPRQAGSYASTVDLQPMRTSSCHWLIANDTISAAIFSPDGGPSTC